jgi:hypothetical protein
MPRYAIRDANIRSIALVAKGANRRRWALLKEQQGDKLERVVPILKSAGEWQTAYIVAEPDAVEDAGMLWPGEEDVWDRDVIAKAAHSFLTNGGLTTDGHFMDAKFGQPVESFIAPVEFNLGDELVKAGSWVIGIRPTVEGHARIESGELGGVSVEGSYLRQLAEPASSTEGAPVSTLAKANLKAAERAKLPDSAFALPSKRAYPIHDVRHARMALAMVSMHGSPADKKTVRAAVAKRYPQISMAKAAGDVTTNTVLTPAQRAALPPSAFALPKRRAYPVHTKAHALKSLMKVAKQGSKDDKAAVKAAVARRYPSLKLAKTAGPAGLNRVLAAREQARAAV